MTRSLIDALSSSLKSVTVVSRIDEGKASIGDVASDGLLALVHLRQFQWHQQGGGDNDDSPEKD